MKTHLMTMNVMGILGVGPKPQECNVMFEGEDQGHMSSI